MVVRNANYNVVLDDVLVFLYVFFSSLFAVIFQHGKNNRVVRIQPEWIEIEIYPIPLNYLILLSLTYNCLCYWRAIFVALGSSAETSPVYTT